ncbi:MAG: hypothetical protein AB1480_07410 [Nitrospirota bacterium]
MIFPGQIIEEGKIVNRIRDGWKVKIVEGAVVLKSRYIPYPPSIKLYSEVRDLIVINRSEVAIFNYMDELINYYYRIPDPTYTLWPKKQEWRNWFPRWANECSYPSFNSSFSMQHFGHKPTFKLYELKGKDYLLPVRGAEVIDHLQGGIIFYPHVIATTPSVYKTDNTLFPFPLKYKGELPVLQKEVFIYLHGCIDPFKWHCIVWKHKYSLTKKEPFENCLYNYVNMSCDIYNCIYKILYSAVHKKIQNDCITVLDEYVTNFQTATTITIESTDKSHNTFKEFDLICQTPNRRIVLPGVCYNWDSQEPTLHVDLKAMYRRGRLKNIKNKIDEITGIKAL